MSECVLSGYESLIYFLWSVGASESLCFFFVFFLGKWFLEATLIWYLIHVYCVVVKILLSIKVFIVCFQKKKMPDKYYNILASPQVFFFLLYFLLFNFPNIPIFIFTKSSLK